MCLYLQHWRWLCARVWKFYEVTSIFPDVLCEKWKRFVGKIHLAIITSYFRERRNVPSSTHTPYWRIIRWRNYGKVMMNNLTKAYLRFFFVKLSEIELIESFVPKYSGISSIAILRPIISPWALCRSSWSLDVKNSSLVCHTFYTHYNIILGFVFFLYCNPLNWQFLLASPSPYQRHSIRNNG